ncbi:MAG: DUF3566 domain-containing protein [Actinomycetota bacterium]
MQTIENQQGDAPQGAGTPRTEREGAVAAPASATTLPVQEDSAVSAGSEVAAGSEVEASPEVAAPHQASRPLAASRNPLRPVSRGSRRTRVVVRRIGPLSVLKFSLIFYFCVMLIVFFALAIIFAVLSAAGAMTEIGKLLGYFFGTGEAGTRDPEPIAINGGVIFTWLFFGGVVFTLVWSVINVFVAFLYNLISDIVGGIDVTLAEKPSR